MIIWQTFFFGFLSQNLIKEIFLLNLISLNGRRALEILLIFYFLSAFFLFKNSSWAVAVFLLPPVFLLSLLAFLKRREEKDLLSSLFALLLPLESQMKMGLSFINAWQKSSKELKSEKTRLKIQKITESLKFQGAFHYPDKEVENFVQDLIDIHQSQSPLKKLGQIKRKARIELSFREKSRRALLQIRAQSGILACFYFSLLIWTLTAYAGQHIELILISFLLFCAGLLWILKAGRRMKWSV